MKLEEKMGIGKIGLKELILRRKSEEEEIHYLDEEDTV